MDDVRPGVFTIVATVIFITLVVLIAKGCMNDMRRDAFCAGAGYSSASYEEGAWWCVRATDGELRAEQYDLVLTRAAR